jgi:hypothetical protein
MVVVVQDKLIFENQYHQLIELEQPIEKSNQRLDRQLFSSTLART